VKWKLEFSPILKQNKDIIVLNLISFIFSQRCIGNLRINYVSHMSYCQIFQLINISKLGQKYQTIPVNLLSELSQIFIAFKNDLDQVSAQRK